jgi:hypothetical protein
MPAAPQEGKGEKERRGEGRGESGDAYSTKT